MSDVITSYVILMTWVWDSKQGISEGEQMPMSSLKRNDSPAELHQAVYCTSLIW